MNKLAVGVLVAVFCISTGASAATLSLVCDVNDPNEGEKVTVYVHTDTPLYLLDVLAVVDGNATITDALNPEDANDYGWVDWSTEPVISEDDGWVWFCGVSCAQGNTGIDGIVGYLKFIYHGGQVAVSIEDASWTLAANAEPVQYSTEPLIFGEPDPNVLMGQSLPGAIAAEIAETPPEPASRTTHLVYFPPEPVSRPAAVTRTTQLVYCPPDTNGSSGELKAASSETFELASKSKSIIDAGKDGVLLDALNEIYITSDITTNQIWTADNVYYIDELVNVQALLVIEPGTCIYFSATYSSLCVNNGGTLISCGTPDNKVFYYAYTDGGYFGPTIYVDETASPATKITNSAFLADLGTGIVIRNNRLDNPIENNEFWRMENGIVEYGTKLTDIVNNVFLNLLTDSITVNLASTEGLTDANSHILIENNTCAGWGGIVVYGACEECEAGTVMMADNIIVGSAPWGIYLEGLAAWGVYNTGYYDNGTCADPNGCGNIWPTDFEQIEPVIATEMPFMLHPVSGAPMVAVFVPGCPFIDAGSQYVEDTHLLGRSTDINDVPDSGIVDIGYHCDCGLVSGGFVNAGVGVAAGDLNKDAVTDGSDLQSLVSGWLHSGSGDANDLNNDGIVNFKDYALLTETWFEIIGHPNIIPMVSGNPADSNGNIDVNVANFGAGTRQAFVLFDGEFLGGIGDFYDDGRINLDTRTLRNGQHSIKAVTIDYNYDITASPVLDVNFANGLHCVSGVDSFEEGRDYQLAAMCSDVNDLNDLRVQLVDWEGNVAYTSPTTTGGVNATIPASAFTEQIYELHIQKQNTGTTVSGEAGTLAFWDEWWLNDISIEYQPKDGKSYDVGIFLPECSAFPSYPGKYRKETVKEIVRACNFRGKSVKILSKGQCNWDNFSDLLKRPSLKYWYIATHGNSHYDEGRIQRTHFQLTGDTTVFSNRAAGGLPPVGKKVNYLAYLNTGEKFKIVYIDACYQLKFDDMAEVVLGVSEPPADRVMISWTGLVGYDINPLFSDWDDFGKNIWYYLGVQEENFQSALAYALSQNSNVVILKSVAYKGDTGNVTFFP